MEGDSRRRLVEERDAQRKRDEQRREAESEAVARGAAAREAQRKRLQAERESVRESAQRLHVEREEERIRSQRERMVDRDTVKVQQVERDAERKRVLLGREAKRRSGPAKDPSARQAAAATGGEAKKPALSAYLRAEPEKPESAARAMQKLLAAMVVVLVLTVVWFALSR